MGKNAPKAGFRAKHFGVRFAHSPSPNVYTPNPVTCSAYQSIGFGYGQRQFLRKINDGPGPGSYEIKSDFERKNLKFF